MKYVKKSTLLDPTIREGNPWNSYRDMGAFDFQQRTQSRLQDSAMFRWWPRQHKRSPHLGVSRAQYVRVHRESQTLADSDAICYRERGNLFRYRTWFAPVFINDVRYSQTKIETALGGNTKSSYLYLTGVHISSHDTFNVNFLFKGHRYMGTREEHSKYKALMSHPSKTALWEHGRTSLYHFAMGVKITTRAQARDHHCTPAPARSLVIASRDTDPRQGSKVAATCNFVGEDICTSDAQL